MYVYKLKMKTLIFPKMLRNVEMAVPRTAKTKYRDGSVQAI